MPVVFFCFDLLHFAGIDLRACDVRGPPALPRAMPAALAARAARARRRGRRRAARRGGRERLRRRGRQAQGRAATKRDAARPRGSRSSPTQTADFVIGGYTQGKGARAPLGAVLVGYWDDERAALRLARRLGLRRHVACAGQGAPRSRSQRKTCPFAERARAERADDVGRARRRGRGELPELDRRRPPARARVPAPARRRRSRGACAGRSAAASSPATPGPDRRHRSPSSRNKKAAFTLAVGPHRIKPHQPRPRLLAGGPGAQAARR